MKEEIIKLNRAGYTCIKANLSIWRVKNKWVHNGLTGCESSLVAAENAETALQHSWAGENPKHLRNVEITWIGSASCILGNEDEEF